ncbi:MAG: DNA adenine methylase [Alphaproteobacteria bacterium]|nr:DNA adenine methylase [Alphaproteobacteria bacterium]
MPLATSPLRYPGGKVCLLELMSRVLRLNNLKQGHYAEPYAGGCGLALALLFGGHVSDIHINDVDRSIWAFWSAILNDSEELISRMESTPVTLSQWRKQRAVQLNSSKAEKMDLAFSTLFLNRTNRSGIIKNAGVIGGLAQNGQYKIDCRFNKEELTRRIRRINKYRDRIHLHRRDALKFIDHVQSELPKETFLCIDPPYFSKGSSLYTSFYEEKDHEKVADRILKLKNPWVLTYDFCEDIQRLYKARRQFSYALNYSVQEKRVGTELLIASKGLKIPDELRGDLVHRPQYQNAA